MYYDAVKSAFGCFPLYPPGKLEIGDYVRITLGGKVHHRGNLSELLGLRIDADENVSEIEYMSSGVLKGEIAGVGPMKAEARISFSNSPGLYVKGKRRVRRARNLDTVFGQLAKAKVEWSFRNRIVVETHAVEDAELYCSSGHATEMKAIYSANGVPLSIDASAALERRQLLHLANVTGTIAFSPVRIIFGFALGANARDPKGFVIREMDVNDPSECDSESIEDTN